MDPIDRSSAKLIGLQPCRLCNVLPDEDHVAHWTGMRSIIVGWRLRHHCGSGIYIEINRKSAEEAETAWTVLAVTPHAQAGGPLPGAGASPAPEGFDAVRSALQSIAAKALPANDRYSSAETACNVINLMASTAQSALAALPTPPVGAPAPPQPLEGMPAYDATLLEATTVFIAHFMAENVGGLQDRARAGLTAAFPILRAEAEGMRAALESIANNSCCGPCQEAKLVARAALAGRAPAADGVPVTRALLIDAAERIERATYGPCDDKDPADQALADQLRATAGLPDEKPKMPARKAKP